MASVLDSSDEKTNGFKLMRLIVDGGTEALRNEFRKHHPGDLQVVLSHNRSSLLKLHPKIINDDQWDELYPPTGNPPSINNFDITLLSILLRKICSLSCPPSGWNDMPNVIDLSPEADIVRIKRFRNKLFAHISNTSVTTADFAKFWAEISSALVRLGVDQKEINRLENEQGGEEEVKRVLKEWEKITITLKENLNVSKEILDISTESQDISKKNLDISKENQDCLKEVVDVGNEIKSDVKTLVKEYVESRSDDILNRNLLRCNFQKEIELYSEKFTQGTREWVFEKFLSWFNDDSSENRAFIISGLAGMGKSVIAAVICNRFAKFVGASHFFQYNNDQYNDPKILLQSLAWQLCRILPAYKESLIKTLSGKLGESLNSMQNIEALFSILFKEPFSGLTNPGKRILIVLDALDETRVHRERRELADLISNHLHKLPCFIRFLITTRPEKDLIDKFERLNPLVIERNDEKNLADLKLVIKEKISEAYSPFETLLDSLAERCDGSMLFAFFLSEVHNYDEASAFCIDSLPKGIEEHYERYFCRLGKELNLLGITEDEFHSLLGVLAVVREPLPEAFLETLCGSENSKRQMQKVRKAISSLLVVNEDKSISFFHKSLRDWLVDETEHDYSVDVQDANRSIFKLCIKKLDELKERGVVDGAKMTTAIKYSLKYFLSHMLAVDDPGELDHLVSNYVADLEVMFAGVCVNVDVTLNNIFDLINHCKYNDVSENTRGKLERLFSLIKRTSHLLRNYPRTFLQNVVNEFGEELSSEASSLLKTRYKNIVYLEFRDIDRKNDALEFRCLLSGRILGIDISPNHDFVVCCYEEGGIELFSLATGRSEWRMDDFKIELPTLPIRSSMLRHCIVFHPRENLILPGTLDNAITVEKASSIGPFECDQTCSKFTNCCFSSDKTKMVTNYGYSLIVWNVPSGKKERCLDCKLLSSFSFTESGSFFGTVDIDNVFSVYDVTNDYKLSVLPINQFPVEIFVQLPVDIVATFKQNSWCCFYQHRVIVLNHNLTRTSLPRLASAMDIILPSFLYSQELESFLQHGNPSWFLKVKKILNHTFGWSSNIALRYILIGDQRVLIYSCSSNAMHVFSLKSLKDSQEKPENLKGVFSNISRKGNFVYLNNTWRRRFTIRNLDLNKSRPFEDWQDSRQLDIPVVKDGVILYDKNSCPELWNSDLSQRLASFHQLIGWQQCLSVSDELIACVYQSHVIFFNVFTEEIESTTYFKEEVRPVMACSIRHDVLAQIESSSISLWKKGTRVDSWEDMFDKYTSLRSKCITFAEFSPDGHTLAFFSLQINKIFIFDINSMKFLSQIPIYGPSNDLLRFKFFDNENLVCGSTDHTLYLINVDSGEILTCVDFGDIPAPIAVSHEKSIVFVGVDCSERFALIKVHLSRKL